MAALLNKALAKATRLRLLCRAMSLRYAIQVELASLRSRKEVSVRLKSLDRPVCIRPKSTDIQCLKKVFIEDEYSLPFDLHPDVIVDAGANIGMATLQFAKRFPDAIVIAIEPELNNFEMLRRNCSGLHNVILIRGALWPENCQLEIEDPAAEAWTFRVSARSNGGPAVEAITIRDILSRISLSRIDLLKVDIEGAELPLFSRGAHEWIGAVRAIAIELHDRFRPGCAQALYSALAKQRFVQEVRGENIFIKLLDAERQEQSWCDR
jgi:FkbM family methyltransferase